MTSVIGAVFVHANYNATLIAMINAKGSRVQLLTETNAGVPSLHRVRLIGYIKMNGLGSDGYQSINMAGLTIGNIGDTMVRFNNIKQSYWPTYMEQILGVYNINGENDNSLYYVSGPQMMY